MATQVQWRGGTTAEHATFTGAAREITVDTQKQTLVLHDGSTAGGRPLLREDGSNAALSLGSAGTPSLKFTGDTNTGIYSPGADQVAVATNGTGRLFVDASGNVGVGLSGPSYPLEVAAPTDSTINITGGTSNVCRLFFSDTALARGFLNYAHADDSLHIGTAGSERLRIDSAGLVGIGTSTPGSALEVKAAAPVLTVNSAVANASSIVLQENGTTYARFRFDGNNVDIGNLYVNGATIFNAGNAERARIDSSGRLLVGTSSTRTWGGVTGQFLFEGTGFSTSPFFISNSNDQYGCFLTLGKSRGTSVGSNTVVQSGDYLGEISFVGADGSVLRQGAGIAAWVDGTPGANDMPGRLVFSTTADGASSSTERMRIRNTGQVDVFGAANTGFYVRTAGAANSSDALIVGTYSATDTTNGTASFIVRPNGNIENTNNSYGAISDIKLKENIVDANSQWDDLKALQVRNYNFKPETNQQTHTQIGLVAQEAELVSPGLVSESPDRDAEGNGLGTVTKSVNYSVLYMKAVKALQEAMERIETLEQRLNDAGIN
jgi:hypothetical protein